MSAFQMGILAVTLYKVSILACGVAFTFMGYKLIAKELELEAADRRGRSDLEGKFNEKSVKIILKNTMQGTILAGVGVAVVIVTVWCYPPLYEESIIREKGPAAPAARSAR